MSSASNPSSGRDASNHPRRCTATTSKGQPCKRWAIAGGTVCPSHGGSIKRVKEAAQNRLEEQRAAAIATTLGLPVEVDPHQALLDEVHRCAGVVAWLHLQVADLDHDDVVWGRTKVNYGEHGYEEEAAGVNMWVKLYGDWSDRLVKASKLAIDAGVSERLVRLEERKGEMIAELLAKVFDDPELGLDDGQRQALRVVAARHLRAVPL